jgi:hypothetical protein
MDMENSKECHDEQNISVLKIAKIFAIITLDESDRKRKLSGIYR